MDTIVQFFSSNAVVIDVGLRVIGYLLILSFIGVFMYVLGLRPNVLKSRLRISQVQRERKFKAKWENRTLYKWYDRLIQATVPSYRSSQLTKLILVQRILFLVLTLLFFVITRGVLFSLVSSFILVYVAPVGYLSIRLMKIRGNTRSEIDRACILLLQYYHKNNRNILYALKDVSHELNGDAKNTFAMLFIRLQSHYHERDKWTQVFAYQLGTVHGRNLSVIILQAIETGVNIDRALADLNQDISIYKQTLEESLTKEREVAQIGKIPIFLIPITIVLNAEFFMQSNAYVYHFKTALGLQVLTVTVILALFGFAMAKVFEKPNDQ